MNHETKGRAFFEEVRRDHEELRELLGAVSRALAEGGEDVGRVSRMFTSLCQSIDNHFKAEEEGKLFDQITEQAPRLADRVAAVRREHHDLLDQIQKIAARAHVKTGSGQWWQQLGTDFQQFGQALMRHEREEGELIQGAYGVDIGSKD